MRQNSHSLVARRGADSAPRPPPTSMPATSPPPTRSPRRTKLEQAAFYDHLVQTSLQLFAEGGYEAISMRRLAGAVSIPPMSLYRYFPTKAHLIRHVWEHILAQAFAQAHGRSQALREPLERLRHFIDAFLQYWLEHREHYWIVFSIRPHMDGLQPLDSEDIQRPDPQHVFQAVSELLQPCLPAERLSPAEQQLLTELLICKMLGYLLGAIGQALPRGSSHEVLKTQLLDDICGQVLRAGRR